jgi:hypothetical protein
MTTTKSKGKERYVMLRYWLLKSQAWNSLSGNARALYVELAQRYNGSNNGRIPYSVREAVEALHVSQGTAHRLLGLLQERGFIVCTRKGYFNVKTTKDASEWLLTEYDCDHPPVHATKDFMRWQPPEGVDINTLNRQPSHHRKSKTRVPRLNHKSKTRVPQLNHTGTPVEPSGYPSGTRNAKNTENGYPSGTIKAKNEPPLGTPVEHLQLPGRGCEPGVLLPFPEGEPAEKKPWSTPTVEEVPWDTLPTEVRMLVLGLPDPEGCYGRAECGQVEEVYRASMEKQPVEKAPREADQAPDPVPRQPVLVMQDSKEDAGVPPQVVAKQPDAVADVPNQAEKAPPAAGVISAPDPVPARPMLEGDRRREAIRARNQEALRRAEAELRGR